MDNSTPNISIVLPTYNGSRYLREAIDSCLNQTYKNIELIIVDDCSTDDTAEIVHGYRDARIRYVKHEKNMGLPRALNTGFAHAKGDYLTWTSDDNLYLPEAIKKMVSFMSAGGYSFVFSDYYAFWDIDIDAQKLRRLPDRPSLKEGNSIGYCFLYTREVKDSVGEYDQETILAEDYDYWIRISKKFTLGHIGEPLYLARFHKESLYSRRFYEVRVIDFLLRFKHGLQDSEGVRRLFVGFMLQKKMGYSQSTNVVNRILRKLYRIFITVTTSKDIESVLKNYETGAIDFMKAKTTLIDYLVQHKVTYKDS